VIALILFFIFLIPLDIRLFLQFPYYISLIFSASLDAAGISAL